MATNSDQLAVVQELYKRRESLDPEKRAMVDELAKRFNLVPDRFDQMKAELESRAPMSMLDKAKELAKMAVSPITSIPGAVQELLNPAAARDRNLNPETASGLPGQSTNPLADAYGNALAAVATAKGAPSIHEPEITRLRAYDAQPEASPAAEVAPKGAGLISNIRNLYRLYKSAKNLSPTRLAEKGFEGFLDYVEGKTPEAPAATPPKAPVEAQVAAPSGPKAPRSMADYGVEAGVPTGGVVSPAGAELPQPVQSPAQQPDVSTVSRETSTPVQPIKGLARASADANALTQKLIEWGSTPDEALGMNPKGWEKLAADAGVSKFPSEATIRATVYNLKKILAGPKRTPMEALEALKASLAEPEEVAKPTPVKPEAIDIAKALKDEMERSGTIQKVNVRRRIRR